MAPIRGSGFTGTAVTVADSELAAIDGGADEGEDDARDAVGPLHDVDSAATVASRTNVERRMRNDLAG
jgi:hypothetical protein